MNAWCKTVLVLLLALVAVVAAKWLARQRGPWWMGAWAVSLLVFCIVFQSVAAWVYDVPPFSWLVHGRTRYVLCAAAIPFAIVPLMERSQRRMLKGLLALFGVLYLILYSVMPFLEPALIEKRLLAIPTLVDSDGVCIQHTGYTCAPAAAVTALRRLGFPAEEGQIAVWAATCTSGTTDDMLVDALKEHYPGVNVQIRRYQSVAQLREALPVLVGVKFSFQVDHMVTVLDVTDKQVIIGDPLSGRAVYSWPAFEEIWRFRGIVLERASRQ